MSRVRRERIGPQSKNGEESVSKVSLRVPMSVGGVSSMLTESSQNLGTSSVQVVAEEVRGESSSKLEVKLKYGRPGRFG